MNKKCVLIELNEINFDVVAQYLSAGERLPNFRSLMGSNFITTKAEDTYENLEPWIQWPSIFTGLIYDDHKIFRLGDAVESSSPQIFELLERAGFSVGAISPMNAENRLEKPAYFLPDPWTRTSSDNSLWSRKLTQVLKQTVNDNAKARITASSFFWLSLALLRFARPKNYLTYLRLVLFSGSKAWNKSLFLDLFLSDFHLSRLRATSADFSTVFLNAGAHIQHHYLLNSKALHIDSKIMNPSWYVSENADPVLDMLMLYDRLLGDHFEVPNTEFIVATGLSQSWYDRVEFYYRLSDHYRFMNLLGVTFEGLEPRMTRDFLLVFKDCCAALAAQRILSELTVCDSESQLFGQIDNRGDTLFVTLTYPREVTAETYITLNQEKIHLKDHVSFVAIKNGMHQGKGFASFTDNISKYAPEDGSHVSSLFKTLSSYFQLDSFH